MAGSVELPSALNPSRHCTMSGCERVVDPLTRQDVAALEESIQADAADANCAACRERLFSPIALGCRHVLCEPCACEAAKVPASFGYRHASQLASCPSCLRTGVFVDATPLTELGLMLKRRDLAYWKSREVQYKRKKKAQLAHSKPQPPPPSAASSSKSLLDSLSDDSCAVCLDGLFNPVALGCGHIFCKECIREVAKLPPAFNLRRASQQARCPLCRQTGVFKKAETLTKLGLLLKERDREHWKRRQLEERQGRKRLLTMYWEQAAAAHRATIGERASLMYQR